MQLVACNFYVAASAASVDVLTSLLKRAQEHCRRIRSTGPIGVIHAFSDVPYDRSSLHIAGAPSLVREGEQNDNGMHSRNTHAYTCTQLAECTHTLLNRSQR